MEQIAVIAGVGPGLGAALARKFVKEGCDVALLSRSSPYIKNLSTPVGSIRSESHTDSQQILQTLNRSRKVLSGSEKSSAIRISLVNHAANAAWGSFADLTPEAFEGAWRVCTLGGFSLFKTGRTGDATERWREYSIHRRNVCCPW